MHTPVLLASALEALCIREDGLYVDCTLGRGGHTSAILERLGSAGRVIALDRDQEAITAATAMGEDQRLELVHDKFSNIGKLLSNRNMQGKVHGALMDLGVSSPQLDDSSRGFSFRGDGPLDMRMDLTTGMPAASWLNSASAQEIRECLWTYGEERFARRIAARIVSERDKSPITSTLQLAELVAKAVPRREGRINPATRTFQALRILINDELGELQTALSALAEALAIGGRLVVISFHSLEDRMVKRFMRQSGRGDEMGITLLAPPKYRPLVRKPITPDDAEIAANPRARSARMRIMERFA